MSQTKWFSVEIHFWIIIKKILDDTPSAVLWGTMTQSTIIEFCVTEEVIIRLKLKYNLMY